jgi:UDP-N-acetylglucosamine 2-epimerase
LVGDIGIDLIFNNLDRIENNASLLENYGVEPGRYYFFTCHRASNTERPGPLREIIRALEELDLPVVFPIHPRTAKAIAAFGLPDPASFPHVRAVPPIGFFDTQTLIRFAKMVITDSGGVIKEAYFHHTPGIIIDQQTEWVETVEEGWNHIAGPRSEAIFRLAQAAEKPKTHSNGLGNGTAATQITRILKAYLDARC